MAIRTKKKQVNKKPGDGPKIRWSDKQKMEALTSYLLTGSEILTSQATGIPYDTLHRWKYEDWWKEGMEELRNAQKLQTSGKLQKIVDKSLRQLEDRVENGDFFYDQKTGKLTRRPLQGRTLNEVVKSSIDKQVLLEKLQQRVGLQEEAVVDRLASIAEQFKRFAKAKEIYAEQPGVQAGLPAREQVQIEARPDQEASDAQQSTSRSDGSGIGQEG